MFILKNYILILVLVSLPFSASALEVIRVNIDQNTSSQPVDIQLFDNVVLNTVNNFLSYMDDGSYNHLFINRSVKDFVIQAGGYTFDPALGGFTITATNQFNGGLQPVTAKPSIVNEFKLSNLRGTLAMAKLSGQPDSATSEWFINLADNTFLDTSNGGFTVFGKVLDNGMTVIDPVAAIPVFNLASQLNNNGAFAQTPLLNFTNNLTVQNITAGNLVFLNNFRHLFKITDTVDFGDAVAGSTVQKDVVITNTGTTSLTTGHMDTSTISPPFSLLANNCENITLAAGANCKVSIKFSPATADYFVSTMNVTIATYNYTFAVTLRTPTPQISVKPATISFGAQPVFDPTQGLPKQQVVRLTNKGDRDLHLSAINFTGINANEFEFIDNCTTANNVNGANLVPAGGFCILVVNFKPIDLNEKHAAIQILSDDPTNKTLTINIVGGATDDNDGVPRAEEDAAPNHGDANNDGLPDGLQNNVISFVNASGGYSTLVTDTGIDISAFTRPDPASFTDIPANTNFSNGLFSFQIAGLNPGSAVKVGLLHPASQSVNKLYVHGPSSQNTQAHWIALDNTTIPSAVVFGHVSLTNPSGNKITANISQLIIVDGGDGDADGVANGTINFTGAADMKQPSSSGGSGAFSMWFLWLVVVVGTGCRIVQMKQNG